MTDWKSKSWRLWPILLLLVAAFALNGPRLLSRAWGNAGQIALAHALVATPGEPVLPAAMEAEALLRRAVTYASGNRSAWRGLGFALAAQEREDEAMAAWQTAGEMAEEFIRHGQVARRSKRYEEALTWYKRATVLAPDWGAPWYYMGLAYEELEAWGDALNSFRQAEKRVNSIEEISGSLYLHLGRVLQEHIEPPDLPAALRLYEAALTSDRFIQNWERIGAHLHRGGALRRQGRMQEARQEFWWVVNAQPEHYWGHVLLGVVTWQIDGDLNEAEKSLKQAIVLKPEEKIAYWWLARIYQKEGRLGEAAEAYQQVLAIDPEDEAALQFFREAGR